MRGEVELAALVAVCQLRRSAWLRSPEKLRGSLLPVIFSRSRKFLSVMYVNISRIFVQSGSD